MWFKYGTKNSYLIETKEKISTTPTCLPKIINKIQSQNLCEMDFAWFNAFIVGPSTNISYISHFYFSKSFDFLLTCARSVSKKHGDNEVLIIAFFILESKVPGKFTINVFISSI